MLMNRLIAASLYLFCTVLLATPPVTDQWELKKKTAGGFESFGLTAENGKVIGFTDGVPTMLSLMAGSGSVTSVAISGTDGIEIDSGSPVTTAGTIALGINVTTLKTHLSLSNVENTALSTWAGTTNITTLGTIATGVWNGTAIGTGYLASGVTLDTEWDTAAEINAATTDADFLTTTAAALAYQPLDTDLTTYAGITPSANVQTLLGSADYAAFKTSLSLNNVENTALSTWAGTTSITTLGTISTGVWNGTAIGTSYLASGATLDTEWDTAAEINAATTDADFLTTTAAALAYQPLDTDLTTYAGITPSANVQTLLGSADYSAFKTSLSLNSVENTALSTWAGTSNITTLGTIAAGTWNGSVIGSAYGGAGAVSGIMKADGLGTVSAASAGTDYEAPVTFSTGLTDSSNTITVDQTFTPTWTGIHTFTPAARSSGSASYFVINTPADTGLTAATESVGVKFTGATRTFADGTIALQRERYFSAPTYNKTTTSATITDVFNLYLDKPVNGTGVTFTRPHTLGIVDATSASSSITGGLIVATTLGTSATSVGIGGGNVYMGGNLNVGGTQTHTGALTQTGAATFNGTVTQTTTARSSGSAAYYTLTTPADTNATTGTEHIGAKWTAATRQHATGALTLQRERLFDAPTYSFVGASTLTTAINVDIADPIQGTNATITNAYSLRAANVLFTGLIKAGSAPTTLTDSTGKILSASLNTVAVANGGTGATTLDDLITLGTHTTGNYMADVSGTSNEISVSHTPAEGSTATLSLPADINLGGKTSLQIPNGAAPTVDAFGELAGDNDLWAASRGAPIFFDGTAATALVNVLVSDTPSNGQVPVWNTGGTITWETPSGTGTVTSVAVSGSDGIDIDSGSPITGAGTIALGINASTLKTHLSLNNVENTALSTWAGTSSITTLGTIATGVWNGTAIGTGYLASGATLDTEWDTLAEVETAMGSINILAATEVDTLSELNAIIGDADILPTSGGTLSGNITLGENTSIALDPAGSADGKYSGTTVTGTAGATLAFGDVVVLDVTDSRWELADANSAAAADGDSRALLGICVLAAASDGSATTILLHGIVRADTAFPTLTVGAPVYVSETAGDIVVTQPTTADVVIRVLGHALTADEIFFNPDNTWITHL